MKVLKDPGGHDVDLLLGQPLAGAHPLSRAEGEDELFVVPLRRLPGQPALRHEGPRVGEVVVLEAGDPVVAQHDRAGWELVAGRQAEAGLGDPGDLAGGGKHPEALHDAGPQVGQLPEGVWRGAGPVGQHPVELLLQPGLHPRVVGDAGHHEDHRVADGVHPGGYVVDQAGLHVLHLDLVIDSKNCVHL